MRRRRTIGRKRRRRWGKSRRKRMESRRRRRSKRWRGIRKRWRRKYRKKNGVEEKEGDKGVIDKQEDKKEEDADYRNKRNRRMVKSKNE